jgi:hypothetical protein
VNPILQQAESAVRQKVDQRLLPAINTLFNAGKALMYDPKTRHMSMAAMKQTDPSKVGASFGALSVILHSQHKNVPMQVVIPTAQLLLCEGLQFMEDGGVVKVSADFLAAATKAMFSQIMQTIKATPQNLQAMINAKKAQGSAAPAGASAPTGIISQVRQGGIQ